MQPYPTYQNYGYNNMPLPYQQQQQIQPFQDRLMQLQQQYNQYQPPMQQPVQNYIPLQGKMVDGLDVVKAFDTPLDGSIVYFPTTTGDCIFTKQIQADGTSRINTYRLNNEPDTKTDEAAAPQFDMAAIAGYLGQFKQEIVQEVTDNISGSLSGKIDELKGMFPVSNTRGGNQK